MNEKKKRIHPMTAKCLYRMVLHYFPCMVKNKDGTVYFVFGWDRLVKLEDRWVTEGYDCLIDRHRAPKSYDFLSWDDPEPLYIKAFLKDQGFIVDGEFIYSMRGFFTGYLECKD